MKLSRRFLSFLFLIGIFALSCEDEEITWLNEMEGALDYSVPAAIGKNKPVVFTAGGIVTPADVVYVWNAPNFTPSTFTGTTFEAISPAEIGEYPVTVTVKSTGYRDITLKKPIVVTSCAPMQGELDFSCSTELIKNEIVTFIATGITSPTENITYTWYAPGFSPESYTGSNNYTAKTPNDCQDYTITLTARAEDYCEVSINKPVTVKEGRKMQGMFDIEIPSPLIRNQVVEFTAKGIVVPSAGAISYTWSVPSFTAATASGNSLKVVCPSTQGTYPVTVTAHAQGYSDTIVGRDVVIQGELAMEGGLSIIVPENVLTSQTVTFSLFNNITLPAAGLSFVWIAPGFTPSTYESTNTSFVAIAPSTEDQYTIQVTPKAAKYHGELASVTVNVKGGLDIVGLIDFASALEVVKSQEASFNVTGIITAPPGGTGITYTWSAPPDFSPSAATGTQFKTTCNTEGSFPITLTIKASGYTDRVITKTIVVNGELGMDGTLSVSSGGTIYNSDQVTFTAQGITNPSSAALTYKWECSDCTPSSGTGAQFTTNVRATPGASELKVTVSSPGYQEKYNIHPFEVSCKPIVIPSAVITAPDEILQGGTVTFSAPAPSEPLSGYSYQWDFPGFNTTGKDLTAKNVTLPTPTPAPTSPLTATLTLSAPGYCPVDLTKPITIKGCYPLPTAPTITGGEYTENGIIHIQNRHTVTFTTPPITPHPLASGAITYTWTFDPHTTDTFTPTNQTGVNNTFTTNAPKFISGDTIFRINLNVNAPGYCSYTPVSTQIAVTKATGKLSGYVEIEEAVLPTTGGNNPTVWLATNRSITLHANYVAGSGEDWDNAAIRIKWSYIMNNVKYPLDESGNNTGTLQFTPTSDINNGRIMVEAIDLNGKQSVVSNYPYTVQTCDYAGPGLYMNINNQCRTAEDGKTTAYVADTIAPNTAIIYKMVRVNNRWWLAENLRSNKAQDASIINSYGAYYPGSFESVMESTDGTYCPKGWRIPSKGEWEALSTFASTNSQDAFRKIIVNNEWTNISNLPGLDTYGLSVLPGGMYYLGDLRNAGQSARFLAGQSGGTVILAGHTESYPMPGAIIAISKIAEASYNVRCIY